MQCTHTHTDYNYAHKITVIKWQLYWSYKEVLQVSLHSGALYLLTWPDSRQCESFMFSLNFMTHFGASTTVQVGWFNSSFAPDSLRVTLIVSSTDFKRMYSPLSCLSLSSSCSGVCGWFEFWLKCTWNGILSAMQYLLVQSFERIFVWTYKW